MRELESRIQFQSPSTLFDRRVVVALVEVHPSQRGARDERQRIDFLRAAHLPDGFAKPASRRQVIGVPLVADRIARIEPNGTLERRLRLLPVPVVIERDVSN
jgi:hypothetical protein